MLQTLRIVLALVLVWMGVGGASVRVHAETPPEVATMAREDPALAEQLATQVSVTAATAGFAHSCALTAWGGVKCWGLNVSGQLGDGSTNDRQTPVDVAGLSSGVVAISAGFMHTCALTTSGGVKCWGGNGMGQLGDGSTNDRQTPVDVAGLSSGVVAIDAGASHTCALTTGGGAKCWGGNGYGQLGDGTATQRLTPVDVEGLEAGVEGISAGGYSTCALTTGGGAKCWGNNDSGTLGDGSTTESDTPVDVVGLASGVKQISTDSGHTCAVMTTGGVKCWGSNGYGQVGDGTTEDRHTPADVVGLGAGAATATSVGQAHTCAMTTTGAAVCWGTNDMGQMGDGTTTDRHTPVGVAGLGAGVEAMGVGGYHACAVMASGALKCWGYNAFGQLGDGTTTAPLTPVQVVGLEGYARLYLPALLR